MDRTETLAAAKRVLVKVGSAVLTTDTGLDLDMVDLLTEQIAWLHGADRQVVLVSSGAVAAGRGVLQRDGFVHVPQRQAASAVGQSRLMHAYDQSFAAHDLISAQILLTRDDLGSRRRFLNARNTFQTLLEWGVVPVVNENDTVVVTELEFGDNDNLAGQLLNLVEADLFVNLTSAAGVFDTNPDIVPDAACLACIEDIDCMDLEHMCSGKTSAGRGGMYSKLLAARRAAQLGVPTLILPGREPGVLRRAFEGEELGTWVRAGEQTVSSRKFWMAYNTPPSGTIVVDRGAAGALADKGKSLLPIGIRGVEGRFNRGALVRIVTEEGDVLGVGLSNYPADALKRIMRLHSHEIEPVLGYAYDEAVHRDNLLLDAAIPV